MKNVSWLAWQYRYGNANHKPRSKTRKVNISYFTHPVINHRVSEHYLSAVKRTQNLESINMQKYCDCIGGRR
jgi:predicted DNA binding CopG/RHH family protein